MGVLRTGVRKDVGEPRPSSMEDTFGLEPRFWSTLGQMAFVLADMDIERSWEVRSLRWLVNLGTVRAESEERRIL